LSDAIKCRNDLFLVADIARIGGSEASRVSDLFCGRFGVVGVEIQNARRSAIRSKFERDGTSNAASGTRNDCCRSIETKFGLRSQRETPRFQGMKSSCDFSSAFNSGFRFSGSKSRCNSDIESSI
jgi:hypothetical protein